MHSHTHWSRPLAFLIAFTLVDTVASSAERHPDDVRWRSDFGRAGVDGSVLAIHEFQGDLVVGGDLSRVVDAGTRFVARRVSERHWEDIGTDLPRFSGDRIEALADYGGQLVAGGRLFSNGTSANYVGVFDGTRWFRLPGSFELESVVPTVHDLIEFDSELIAAGHFSSVGSIAAPGVARWNGSAWQPMGPGTGPNMHSLAALGTGLYASGFLETVLPEGAMGVLSWNGGSWDRLGGAFSSLPGIAAFDGALYAVGSFSAIGGAPAEGFARWNGVDWEVLPAPPFEPWSQVATTQTHLIVAGWVDDVIWVAQWDGQQWTVLGDEIGEGLWALGAWNGSAVVAGPFGMIGPRVVNGLATWDADHWRPFGGGHGLRGGVECQLGGQTLYLGGSYLDLDGIEAGHLAEWDGHAWHARGQDPLPEGPVFGVSALCRHESRIVGTPRIQNSQFDTESYVAWLAEDGQRWTPFGKFAKQGYTWADMRTLTSLGDSLLVAGNFDTVDGTPIANLACWDGQSWLPYATNPGDWISDLVVWRERIVVMGEWDPANGGGNEDGPLMWDGNVWIPLLMNDIEFLGIQALGVHEDQLVVSVRAWVDGDLKVLVRSWDGQEWSTWGDAFSNHVLALRSFDGELYAAGAFSWVGETLQRGIARWNGVSWKPLGSGLDPFAWVTELGVAMGELYLTGPILEAGSESSVGIAGWMPANVVATPVSGSRGPIGTIDAIAPNPFNSRMEILFDSTVPGPGEIRVYTAAGRLIASFPLGQLDRGPGRALWTGLDRHGRPVASGVYLVELRIGGVRGDVRRAVLIE